MNAENFFSPAHIRTAHYHATIEAPRPQQRRIEHIGTVRCSHQDDAFIRLKSVHLDQQLVQRLLALVVTATQASATVTPDSVDLVDENDARSIFLALLKQVANPAGTHAYDHLDEV